MVTLEDETTQSACTVPSARTRGMSNYQRERLEKFRAAHAAAEPLIVVNCWDPASAAVISRHPDCQAVGTSSAGMAASKGCRDGEVLTAQQVIAAVTDICAVTNTPVSVDIEGGYVETAELGAFVSQLTACGAVGINIEDVHDGHILPVSEAAARIGAIRAFSEAVGRPVFINARTDAFWQPDRFDDPLGDALLRIAAFADAGADGVVVEGLGSGNVPPALASGLRSALEARPDLGVVVTSRVPRGEVTAVYGGTGGGAELARAGVLFSGHLRAGQAWVLLACLMQVADGPAELRRDWDRFARVTA